MNTRVILSVMCGVVILTIAVIVLLQIYKVEKAHSTFDNYYAFRRCAQLLDKTDISAHCVTNSGQTIKLVYYKNGWYLDGDLPSCVTENLCF